MTPVETWTSLHALLASAACVGALARGAWWVAGALAVIFAADLAAVLAPSWPEGLAWQCAGPLAVIVGAWGTWRR